MKVGPTAFFKCTDWQKLDGVYSKLDAQTMLTACKSLKDANPKAAPVPAPAKGAKAAPPKKK